MADLEQWLAAARPDVQPMNQGGVMRRLVTFLVAGAMMLIGGPTITGADPAPDERVSTCAHDEHQLEARPDKFVPCQITSAGGGATKGDFNGDGFGDLAVGVPGEDIGTVTDAGAVHIIYGSADGLRSAGNQLWTQGSSSAGEQLEANDGFGASLAAGDFDGDGISDLAIGVPKEDLVITAFGSTLTITDAGVVHVLYGTPVNGLSAQRRQVFSQDEKRDGDQFGFTLVWADFGRTTEGDLAIGEPFEDVGDKQDAGQVQVLYGSLGGLTTQGQQEFNQDTGGINDVADPFDHFGAALAAANFGRGAQADLAIGIPLEDAKIGFASQIQDAGAVDVLYGTANGLTDVDDQTLSQSDSSVETPEPGDEFGFSLAAGNVFADSLDDLFIGVPFEDLGSASNPIVNAGLVHFAHGAFSEGLVTSVGLETLPVLGGGGKAGDGAEDGDRFGWSMTVNDFGDTALEDVAIGAPFEDVTSSSGGQIADAGAVSIFLGGPVAPSASQFWHQRTTTSTFPSSIAGEAGAGDQFGFALSAWNFGNGSQADLAIGVPHDSVPRPEPLIGNVFDAGSVNVLYGSSTGLTVTGNQRWHQNVSGMLDAAETGDRFGATVY
jgi:hypothetical protein